MQVEGCGEDTGRNETRDRDVEQPKRDSVHV